MKITNGYTEPYVNAKAQLSFPSKHKLAYSEAKYE